MKLNPKKLLNSKWTALSPTNKERHFLVYRVDFNAKGDVTQCVVEAVHSKRRQNIDWRTLENGGEWQQGWLE